MEVILTLANFINFPSHRDYCVDRTKIVHSVRHSSYHNHDIPVSPAKPLIVAE